MTLKSIAIETAGLGAAGCLIGSIYSFSPEEGLHFTQEIATGAMLGIASRVGAHYLLHKNRDLWKKRAAAFGIPLSLRALSLVKAKWYSSLTTLSNRSQLNSSSGTNWGLIALAAVSIALLLMNNKPEAKKKPPVDEDALPQKDKDPLEDPTERTINLADHSLSDEQIKETEAFLGHEEMKRS